MDCLYLDLKKAFDSVPHIALLIKLWRAGITGNLWKWFLAYLTQQKQCVAISGTTSQFLPGVIWHASRKYSWTLLFLICINDLPLHTSHSMVLLLADATICLKQINSPVDSLHPQCDLNALHACSKDWNLSFNEPKTILIQFNKENIYPQFNYTLNDKIITVQDNHRDLVVITSCDLSWDEHLNTISKKAYQTLVQSQITYRRFPHLWNALPVINFDQSISTITRQLKEFMWSHFKNHFDSSNPCSFHFVFMP